MGRGREECSGGEEGVGLSGSGTGGDGMNLKVWAGTDALAV